MKILRMLGATALGLILAANAFATTPTVQAPAGTYVPTNAICYGTWGASCTPVTSTNGLPVQIVGGGGGGGLSAVASATHPTYSAGFNSLAMDLSGYLFVRDDNLLAAFTANSAAQASAANQTISNASLATIATNTAGLATATLQTAANSSLATLATASASQATAANQATANSSLATIATNSAGAATAANQSTGNTALASIVTNTAASATSALQATGNTALASIASNTSGVASAANQTSEISNLSTVIAEIGATSSPVSGSINAQLAALNSTVSAGASAPIPAQTVHNTLIGAVEGNGVAGSPDTHVISVQGVSGGTGLPVTGTFWQATQPVSGTFWQATQPVSGTFWQATQPVSAAALPLPAGAATSANQTSVQSASGTSSSTALTVQGNASGVAIPVSLSGVSTAANQTNVESVVGTSAATAITVQGSASGVSLPVQDAATGATGSAVPAKAIYTGANSGGNLTGIVQGNVTIGVSATTATTTQIIALVSGKAIYVTHAHIVASAAASFQLVYGTGTACGTGTVYLDGASGNPMAFAANGGFSAGSGLGPVYVIPAGNALCLITATGGVNYAGSITYTQH